MGTGPGAKVTENQANNNDLLVSFDLETLYIPPLTSSTTKFLGLPLPPLLKIDIVPQALQGSVNQESGKVSHKALVIVVVLLQFNLNQGSQGKP